ncbi:MAG TPA: thiamine pyrophosphate-binding protein [Alphaproteobacteria bacterium]|nr:thiamine pyrophosphate-binding protein [Alphaproteobacteria bacterium]
MSKAQEPHNRSDDTPNELPAAPVAQYGSDHMAVMLRDMGFKHIFVMPGSSFRGLHDSLVNHTKNVDPQIVLAPHEMVAVAMAHGYAKATNELSCCILHNLVGLMSGSMGVFNAYCDQTPILLLGGSGPADPAKRRLIDWAHSAGTQSELVRSYVKWTDEPATLPAVFDSLNVAQRKAVTAPRGPVYLSIDAGLQEDEAASIAVPKARPAREVAPPPAYPNAEALEKVAQALIGAKLPMIVGGRFGLDKAVTAPLKRLVEITGAAYQDDRNIVCLANTHPQNLNGDKKLRGQADVIVAFDCQDRVSFMKTSSDRSAVGKAATVSEDAMLVDISMNDYFGTSWTYFAGPLPEIDVQIHADPLTTLKLLLARVEELAAKADAGRPARVAARVKDLAAKHDAMDKAKRDKAQAKWTMAKPILLERMTHELYEAVKNDDWSLVVRNHRSWCDAYWPIHEAGRYLGGDGGGGVGYGVGAAVGAALALKGTGKLPVAIVGDGDYLMGIGGLWTAAHYEIPLLLVVANNQTWGNDEVHQREVAHMRERPVANAHIGLRMADPGVDIAGTAKNFGLWSRGPIDDPAELAKVFAEAAAVVRGGQPAFVEVRTALR